MINVKVTDQKMQIILKKKKTYVGETFPKRILKQINGPNQQSLRITADDEYIQTVPVHYYKLISHA